jgi:hypothetical protein
MMVVAIDEKGAIAQYRPMEMMTMMMIRLLSVLDADGY